MGPFARAGADARIDVAVKNYASNLEERKPAAASETLLEGAFLDAWQEEVGASFDETRRFMDAIEDLGHQAGKAVFEAPKSALLSAKFEGEPFAPPRAASALVEFLTLRSRASWRDIPEGYEAWDIHPWRFRRRLTVLRKPLVQLDSSDNPSMIVAPALARDAFGYMLGNYHRGDFLPRQLKPRMGAWGGAAANRQGSQFTVEVAERLRELGWQVESEIKITKLLRKGFAQDYGDVDVLAWNPDTGRVLIIECKDVQYRKTFGEIAEQLSDFRGETKRDGKPDLMRKHLNRVELVANHLRELAVYIAWSRVEKIESHLVFKNPVPMQFALNRMEEQVRLHVFDALDRL